MEDINARRNARRRRILENSEKRLLKITGRDGDNEFKSPNVHFGISSQMFVAADIEKEILYPNVNDKISDVDPTLNRIVKPSSARLITNRINYILLAVIVNILLVLQLDFLFGKTITIPYFPIMLGRLYNYKNAREMQENNLLYAALILCNIKPELTYQLKKLVTIIHMILGDLALYIFSFTLIHYILLLLMRNTDIPITLNI
ncbi:uncharacterized protein LOC143425943 [Xylocopa sonorina]|uniref:uncharacterized protein LOC143425943 n=1 Tax=Xylocopa sonorina TaxID=1818115 RepID=UPI00403B0B82